MPLSPSSPVAVQVDGPKVEKNLTTYQILELAILLDPNNDAALTARVRWARGVMDGEKFLAVDVQEARFNATQMATKIDSVTTGRLSLYAEVKNAVWQLLAEAGLVPAGTIN